eukprot:scaffold177215_cov27-Tisochrysis_lutea.AAC.2
MTGWQERGGRSPGPTSKPQARQSWRRRGFRWRRRSCAAAHCRLLHPRSPSRSRWSRRAGWVGVRAGWPRRQLHPHQKRGWARPPAAPSTTLPARSSARRRRCAARPPSKRWSRVRLPRAVTR